MPPIVDRHILGVVGAGPGPAAVVLIGGAGTGEEKQERVGTSDQPTGGPAAEGPAGRPAGNGTVNILLPRLREVSGIEALTAECRDITLLHHENRRRRLHRIGTELTADARRAAAVLAVRHG